MRHTSKPEDWTAEQWAEYRQCEADHQDELAQVQDRENAYERGDITGEQYRNWEFDYGPSGPMASTAAHVGAPGQDDDDGGDAPPF